MMEYLLRPSGTGNNEVLRLWGRWGTVFKPRKDKNKQHPCFGFEALRGGTQLQQGTVYASFQSVCTLIAHHTE